MNMYDPATICRACLTPCTDLVPLFDCNNIKIFNLCTYLEAEKGDNFPQKICNYCLAKCMDWFNFKSQCEKAQEKYMNSMSDDLGEAEYVALNYDDIIALSPANSIHNAFIGSLSDEELMNVQEVEQTSDFEVDSLEYGAVCSKCGDTFKNAVRLAQHVREFHASALSEVCATCNKGFASARALRRHKQKHETVAEFRCQVCKKSFKYQTSLNLHHRKHQGERKHVCQICGRAFFRSSSLDTHMYVHQSEKPFTCHCGKSFKNEQMLKSHEQRHVEDAAKKFECTKCEKKFVTNAEQIIHMRSHTNEKPFSCEQCGKCYKTASHLSVHQRTHNGTKQLYNCGVCGSTFDVKSVLKQHEQTHAESKKNVK